MTDSTIVVLVAAIPSTIVSLTAAIIALAGLRKTREVGVDVAKTAEKVAAVNEKAETIKTATDGHLSKLSADLAVALERIAGFERLIAEAAVTKRETAVMQGALLEAAAAAPSPTQISIPGGRRANDKE